MIKKYDILLVEDNPADIKLTLKAFEKQNLADRIFVVKDGEEAINFIFFKNQYEEFKQYGFPKVILLDLNLPKIHGLDVLKEIKSNETTKIIPVVILTTSQEESDLIRSYNLGANSYIVKPVDFQKFINAVTEIGIYWLFFNRLPDRL